MHRNRKTPQTLNCIWGVLLTKKEGSVAQNRTSYLITSLFSETEFATRVELVEAIDDVLIRFILTKPFGLTGLTPLAALKLALNHNDLRGRLTVGHDSLKLILGDVVAACHGISFLLLVDKNFYLYKIVYTMIMNLYNNIIYYSISNVKLKAY